MPIIEQITQADYGIKKSPHGKLQEALGEIVDDAVMEGFSSCLSMVHDHLRDLRTEYIDKNKLDVVTALDRLYNRIAEDTK